MKKIITLLGSTGSIGTQTLDVVRMHGLEVYALAAYHNVSLLEQQVREFHPKKVCIFDESCYPALRDALSDLSVEILTGMDGLCELRSLEWLVYSRLWQQLQLVLMLHLQIKKLWLLVENW